VTAQRQLLLLECIVGRYRWWCENEVADFCGILGCQGGYNIVKFSLLLGDVSSGELGLKLREPDLWKGQNGGSLTFTAVIWVAAIVGAVSLVIVLCWDHQCRFC